MRKYKKILPKVILAHFKIKAPKVHPRIFVIIFQIFYLDRLLRALNSFLSKSPLNSLILFFLNNLLWKLNSFCFVRELLNLL